MICLDTNFLVAALVSTAADHSRAVSWLKANVDRLSTTSVNVGETLRLMTHPRVFPRPATLAAATATLLGFLETFEVEILELAPDWLEALAGLLATHPGLRTLRGNDVFDASIALTMRDHDVQSLLSQDEGFDRFPFVRRVRF